MADETYTVAKQSDGTFSVVIGRNGKNRTVPGFGSEHEAEAWIVQMQRARRSAEPWTKAEPRSKTGTQ